MTCNKEHRYLEIFTILPESQGGSGRHICCGCAFEQGILDALNSCRTDLSTLPNSQAGTVRHKDATKAYQLGYEIGQSILSNKYK